MNDPSSFADLFVGLIETIGPSGPTGPINDKPFKPNDKVGTTLPIGAGPVDIEWSRAPVVTGPRKREVYQPLVRPVTTGTSGTTSFAGAGGPSASADSLLDWLAYLDRLRKRSAPDWMSDRRWSEVIIDTENFLSTWGGAAHSLGWTLLDLLGVHPVAPAERVGIMGLIFLAQRAALVEVTAGTATLRRASGAILIYRRHDTSGAVLIDEAQHEAR